MEVRFCRSKCIIAFVGAVYICTLLDGVISASVNKAVVVPSSVLYDYVHAKPINPSPFNKTDQLNYRRHRRKLPNESSDQQFNSLDDSGLQFQEYQGVFGRPGVDFPVLSHVPVTKFNCRDLKNSNTGYYADLDTHCQVFHVCDGGRKVSFLCPNGTIFRQSHLICDWWFRVECERSPELYEQSVQQLEADQNLYKKRAETITNAMHNLLAQGIKESTLLESPVSVTKSYFQANQPTKSVPNKEVNFRDARPTNYPAYDFPQKNMFQNVDTNRPPGPNFGVTAPIPNQATFNYQNYAPVTPTTGVTKSGNPNGRNIATNFKQPAKANSIQTNQKAQTNYPNTFSGVNFDFNTNTITFTQPPSNTVPVRSTNVINSTPLPPRQQNSNWTPISSYNAISSSQNNFNGEQKANNGVKYSAAFPAKSQPIMVPNFTPGKYPITDQNYPTTRFAGSPPKTSVSATLPPRTTYNTELTTPSFSQTYFTMTSGTTPAKTAKPTTKLQAQTTTFGQTSFSTPSTTLDNNYFREQQILAETASFVGNGKYPNWQNYYLNQNFNSQTNVNTKPAKIQTTSPVPATQTTFDPDAPTTFNIYNMLFDSQLANNSNQSYALYFPSDENVIDLLNLVTPEPDEGVTDAVRNFSRPAVSELLLNSFGTSMNIRETTPAQPARESFPILLRNETREAYDQLFTKTDREPTTSKPESDLLIENSNGLVQSSSPKPSSTTQSFDQKLKLKSTPDFRELAQIFSRALSAYLEDPEQFRKILSEVRPTEPPSLETPARLEAADDEVLAFSEDERTVRRPTASSPSTTPKSIIRDPETFAEEINNFMFDPLSFQSQTDSSYDFNINETYFPSTIPTTPITFTVSPLFEIAKNRTRGTTLPTFPSATPLKVNLYDDKSQKFFDNNVQNLQEEPLLITADTQSFVAPDNLIRYPLYGKFAGKYTLSPPNLKSPAYPQFGVRTSSATFTPYISSRADVATTLRTTVTQTAASSVTAFKPPRTTLPEETLRTALNIMSSDTMKPLFNESAVNAMVDMMQEAQTNPTLRNKLVLLLVNDGRTPENRSVRDLKSKLLKALLVPLSTKAYDNGYTEQPISRRKVRKDGRTPTARLAVTSTTPLYRPPTDFISKSTAHATTRVSRIGRATARPAKQVEPSGLTDTDSRAVDLLKTLYSLASNNWNR